MKRILFLGFNSFFGHKRGVENVIEFQASVCDKPSYYICFGDHKKVYRWHNMICVTVPSGKGSLKRFMVVYKIVRRLVKQRKIDAVHSHNYLMSLVLCRRTDIFTVHDGLYYQNKEIGKAGKVKMVLYRIIERCVYWRTKHVHFISQFAKENSLYPQTRSNYSIIYNTSNFQTRVDSFEDNRGQFCTKFPMLHSRSFYLLVRSLEERARIDLIIEVARQTPEKCFVVAGKGPLLDHFRQVIVSAKIKNVHLLGFVSDQDLIGLYHASKAVIVPAEHGEGFGLPIIEGYMFDKLVLASNKCAIPEVIIDKEYLFENTPASLGEKLKQMSDQTSNAISFRDYYDAKFSNKIILEKYRKLYSICTS